MNFIRVKWKKFLFFKPQFLNLVAYMELEKKNTKYQLSISKIMPARPKNIETWGLITTVTQT